MSRLRLSVAMIMAASGHQVIAQPVDEKIVALDPSDGHVIRINVFSPVQDGQEETIRNIQQGLDTEMIMQNGLVSATVHRSLDSDHIAIYAQWESQRAFDAAGRVRQSGGTPIMSAVFAQANPDTHPYELVSVHTGRRP